MTNIERKLENFEQNDNLKQIVEDVKEKIKKAKKEIMLFTEWKLPNRTRTC